MTSTFAHAPPLAAARLPAAPRRAAEAPPPQGVVSLSASASVEVPRDLLSVTLTRHARRARRRRGAGALKQALDAALAEARRSRRPGQLEVQTGNFALFPRYGKQNVITGWQGSAELVVEGRDMQAIAALTGRITTHDDRPRRLQPVARTAREGSKASSRPRRSPAIAPRRPSYAKQFGYSGYSAARGQRRRQRAELRRRAARARDARRPATRRCRSSRQGRGAGRRRGKRATRQRRRTAATRADRAKSRAARTAAGGRPALRVYCAVQPPSTAQATPRTLSAAGEHRNTRQLAELLRRRELQRGLLLAAAGRCWPASTLMPSRAARSSICFCTSGVSTQPGQMALTVMPVVAVSSATALVKPTMPCLAAT